MYQLESQGKIIGEFDRVVFIRLNRNNGCYVPCDEAVAEGVCVILPFEGEREITNEETQETTTEMVTIYDDVVFSFTEGGLKGVEPVCAIEKVVE